MRTTSTAAAQPGSGLQPDARAGKYLILKLGTEEFGVRVVKVREIMGIQQITAVPQTPAYVKGVINLRGKAIPVIDLRLKFGLEAGEYTHRTCIVVAQIDSETGPMLVGLIVDGVSEVLNLSASDVEDAPGFGARLDAHFILGMAKLKGKVKILLEIDHVINAREIASFGGLAARCE